MFTIVRDEILKACKKYDVEFKDGETYQVAYERLLDKISDLHTKEELEEIASQLLNKLVEEYGLHAVRIFADYPLIYMKGYKGFDQVYLYENIHASMGATSKAFMLMNKISLKLDKAILENEFRNVFRTEYGYINPDSRLIELITLVHEHFYDQSYIEFLSKDIKISLEACGDKYFHKKELDEEVMREIYKTIGEDIGFPEYRFGFNQDYDGFGNIVWTL